MHRAGAPSNAEKPFVRTSSHQGRTTSIFCPPCSLPGGAEKFRGLLDAKMTPIWTKSTTLRGHSPHYFGTRSRAWLCHPEPCHPQSLPPADLTKCTLRDFCPLAVSQCPGSIKPHWRGHGDPSTSRGAAPGCQHPPGNPISAPQERIQGQLGTSPGLVPPLVLLPV